MDLLSHGIVALELRNSTLVNDTLTNELVKSQNNSRYSNNNDENFLTIITLNEVSRHDTVDDCWIVIYDYVYDCTKFISKHPGGREILVEYAGRDATMSFIGAGHTQIALRLLKKYLIGELPSNEQLYRRTDGVHIVTLL